MITFLVQIRVLLDRKGRTYLDGKPGRTPLVMLSWRQVADLSPLLILICQWRLRRRQREGQREEGWGVIAPLLLHYGVIPLLKRKIRSSPNYLKPILHFTCLTGWGWVGVEWGYPKIGKTWTNPIVQKLYDHSISLKKGGGLQQFTPWVMDGGGGLSTFSVESLLTTLLMNEPLIDRRDTYLHVMSHGLTCWHGDWTAAIWPGHNYSTLTGQWDDCKDNTIVQQWPSILLVLLCFYVNMATEAEVILLLI